MTQETYPTGPIPATVGRWANMARTFAPSHVLGLSTRNSYGATTSGLNLTIGRGATGVAEAFVAGFFHELHTADEVLTVPANGHATQARIDRVVLRWDPAVEQALLTRLQGTPAASPLPPALTQVDRGVWDLPLWRFTVPANNGAPLTGLTDDRFWIDPATGGSGLTVYSTADAALGQTVATLGPLGTGLWEIEVDGIGLQTTGNNQIELRTANGLTTAAAGTNLATSSGRGGAVGGAGANSGFSNPIIINATAANDAVIGAGYVTSNTGSSGSAFTLRVPVRVLTPGAMVVRSLGGTIYGGARCRASLIMA